MATQVMEQDKLQELLGPVIPEKPARPKNRRWILAAGVAVLLAGGIALWRTHATPAAPAYTAAKVRRGNIAKTINATGTLQAVTTVQVGTEVSGTVSALFADYNSQVKKGQVIAKIDPSQFQAQLAQAQATYMSTQASIQAAQNNVLAGDASVQAAQANVEHADAAAQDAQAAFNRVSAMVAAQVEARMDLQTSQAALTEANAAKQQAVAQLNQAKAQAQAVRSQVAQAQAQSAQAKAAVELAQVNVDHTVITAPIDGVVVARNVDVGQTVAASLQAPTVFLIANDLTRMQVLANIDEADVGQVGPDSKVTFTVDAYPNDVFRGDIAQVRLAPQTVQNVVTYTAVINVSNPDLKLKPGMTANVTVVAAQRNGVLAVPNGALRFRKNGNTPTVWKIQGAQLTPVAVQLGMTDGVRTEITGGDLKEGDAVAMAATNGAAKGAPAQAARSPFAGAPAGGGRGIR